MNGAHLLQSTHPKNVAITTSIGEKSPNKAQGLWRVANLLSGAYAKDKIGSIIINEAFDVLGAHNGDISLVNEHNTFELVAQKGYPKNFMQKWAEIPQGTPLLTNHVIKTKKPYYIENEKKLEEKYKVAKLFLKLSNSQSAALIPLNIKNKIIGILQFTFTNPRKFSNNDKVFMNTLAYQAAIAFERVLALDKLRESKEQLEIILKNTADGIVVHNNMGVVTFANEVGTRLLGHDRKKSLIGCDLKSIFNAYNITDPQNNPMEISKLPEYTISERKKQSHALVILIHKKTGVKRWLNIKSNAIYDQNGHISLIISTLQDITKIQELDQRKDDFISMASHELKTPLTSVKLLLEILARQVQSLGDKKVIAYTEKIIIQTDRLHMLVSDLLDVTRIQKGKMQYTYQNFNLNDLIDETIAEQKLTLANNHINFRKTKNIQVHADKFRIYQVLTNLLSNAIKYSPPGSPISIKVKKNNDFVIVSITDAGVGIPDDHKEQIFNRFYQINTSGTGNSPGLGMGLYISSEIIKQHGGEIHVENNKGQGSTFIFSLPLKPKSLNS